MSKYMSVPPSDRAECNAVILGHPRWECWGVSPFYEGRSVSFLSHESHSAWNLVGANSGVSVSRCSE